MEYNSGKAWWEGLQPSWRQQETWPLSRDPPTDGDWVVLRRGGINGFFLVVMCLSWWAPVARLAKERQAFDEARDDVAWVLERLLESHGTSSGAKRPAEESKNATTSKRRRF